MKYTDISYILNFVPDELRTYIGDDNFIFTEANKALGKIKGVYKTKAVFNEEFTVTNHILQFDYQPWKIYVYDDDNCKFYFTKVSIPTRADHYSHNDDILTFHTPDITIYMDYLIYTEDIIQEVDELWEYLVHMVAAAHWKKRSYFKESGAMDMNRIELGLARQKRLAALRKIVPLREDLLRENMYR